MGRWFSIFLCAFLLPSLKGAQGQECFHWRELEAADELGWRRFESVAFDSIRNQAIVAGGSEYFGPPAEFAQTIAWDGGQWSVLAHDEPPSQGGAASAFDSDRGIMVLFGQIGDEYCDEDGKTWEWDGVSWSLAATTGPLPRTGACMAYDTQRKVTILFGGANKDCLRGYFGATWEWDGVSWTLVNGEGPARAYHMCAYDKRRGVFVIAGGYRDDSFTSLLSDTWEWNGRTWSLREGYPIARANSAMAYDDARQTCIMHGGNVRTDLGYLPYAEDTIEWDGMEWKEVPTPPLPLAYHSMVYDSIRRRLVLVGGVNAESKLYELIQVEPDADADSDCDGDLADFAALQVCGGALGTSTGCEQFDVDANGEIDAADFTEWLFSLSGPSE